MGTPRAPAAWDEAARPKRRAGVELRVVSSPREGTRHVLADPVRGRSLELRGGGRDALVWERLDGKRSLRQIGLELVEATGSFPRDLGRFIARLEAEGFLEGREAATSAARRPLGSRVLRPFVPIPGLNAVVGLVARALRFLGSPWLLGLAGVLGAAGAVVATRLSLRGTLLPRIDEGLGGFLALVGVNAAIALLEAFARALALARANGEIWRAGVAFTVGLPEPEIDARAEALLPVEARTLVRAAPLAIALFLGGGAALALFAIGETGAASDPRALAALPWLTRVLWVGLIRALVHANPLAPSALSDALAAWFHLEDLRGAARHFLGHELVQHIHRRDDEPLALSPREHALLGYGAAALVWLVVAARTSAHVALAEVLPRLESAGVLRASALVELGAIALVLLPLGALAAGLVSALARAVARGVARSTLGAPHGAGIAAALIAAALAAVTLPLSPREDAILAALASGIAAWLALRASSTDGRGRAALALTLVALACALAGFAVLLVADMGAHGSAAEKVARVVLGSQRAEGFVLLAAALVELASASRRASALALLGSVVAGATGIACLAQALAPTVVAALPFVDQSGPAPAALAIGAYVASALLSLGSFRPASRFLLAVAALALAVEQAVELGWPSPVMHLLRAADRDLWVSVLAVLWPGLVAAGAIARLRERRARSYALPLDLVEPSAEDDAVLEAILAPLAETVREHLGKGAAISVGRSVASSTGEGVARRALVMLRSCRAVAGERYLARYLEAALERVPSIARAKLATCLEPVRALSELARQLAEGAEPDLAHRGNLFRQVPILSPLPDENVFELAALAIREQVPACKFVVREGEDGDRFYVISKGEALVSIQGKDGIERTVAHLHEGDAFGEAALLRHEARSASVVAAGDLELLAVGRDVFVEFIQRRKELLAKIVERLEDVWLLRSTALFADLESAQVAQLFQRCLDAKAEPNTAIIRQGERGDRFYIIREGVVRVEVDDGKGHKRTVAHLGRGDYFGEMALLHDVARAATVISETPVELVGLGRDDFLRLLRGEARLRLEQESQARGRALERGDA